MAAAMLVAAVCAVAPLEYGAAAPVVSWPILTASDGETLDSVGWSVAMAGETVVVGAPNHDEPGPISGAGSAYVFRPDGSGGYDELQLLGAVPAEREQFGFAVGASDAEIVVGAPLFGPASLEQGAVYHYTPDGPDAFVEQPMTASDGADDDRFGHAVAIEEGTVVVGAPRASSPSADSGAVYVFEPDGLGGYDETKLVPSDGATGDDFGWSVAVSGGVVVVGAPEDDDHGTRSGSVYVFEPDGLGGYDESKLTAGDARAQETFGTSVDISDDTIVTGATGHVALRAGAAYVFRADGLGGYDETEKLTGSDAVSLDRFGAAVAIEGDVIAVGAPHPGGIEYQQGKVYRFLPDGAGAYDEERLYANREPGSRAGEEFGASLAMSGGALVAGVPSDDVASEDEGSARLFGPPLPPAAGGFAALAPVRLLDTRSSGPCVQGAAGRELTVAGVAGVPTDAAAVSLTVTVTAPTGGGYLTVAPSGPPRPVASNLNYVKGQTVANMAIVKVGVNGRVNIFASGGCPHVVVDVAGSFRPGPAADGGFTSLPPTRLLDTRTPPDECVGGPQGLNVTVRGLAGVPEHAEAVALNVTVTQPTASGYLTVSPASPVGAPPPVVSNLNYVRNRTSTNVVIVDVDPHRINLFASAGCAHVILDVAGWFAAGGPAPGGFRSLAPSRIADTRSPGERPCVAGAAGRNLTVAAGFPPFDAGAVAINVTVTGPSAGGYLTVSPAGAPRPVASTLNYVAGQTIPAMVLAKVGAGGQINVYASAGCPHVIVDLAGWMAPAEIPPATP